MKTFDLELLRTFVAIADYDSFTGAADALHKTQSAVTQQMHRLEAQTDIVIFEKDGRGKKLSAQGARLLAHARQLLAMNDETFRSIRDSNLEGSVCIGAPLDVSDTILPSVLANIAKWSPSLKLQIHVGRSPFLMESLKKGEIDLTISTRSDDSMDGVRLRTSPTHWICAADYHYDKTQPVPLILADEPSIFRRFALTALDAANVAWRINYLAPSLPGITAAVRAGLGITARSIELLAPDMKVLGKHEGLPALPDATYSLWMRRDTLSPLVRQVFNRLRDTLTVTEP